MSATPGSDAHDDSAVRAERERRAFDEGVVWQRCHDWHLKAWHIFECPNSLRVERIYADRVREAALGARALELGCADGLDCRELVAAGAAYVRGIDVSERSIARAAGRAVPGKLDFACADAAMPVEGQWDVIFGKAILHHLDWRALLPRLYEVNLRPGGRMVFLEPLGANLLLRAYRRLSRSSHTRDEVPFYASDLRWLRARFPGMEIVPRNYLSLLFGIASSRMFARADNGLMRLADRMDWWLARNVPSLAPRFRQAVFVIRKPS